MPLAKVKFLTRVLIPFIGWGWEDKKEFKKLVDQQLIRLIPEEMYAKYPNINAIMQTEPMKISELTKFLEERLLQKARALSMPIIATFTLFYSVFRWNDWYTALIYISDPFKYPLPLIMRNMIVKNQVSFDMLASYSEQMMGYVSSENMKMATVVVATLPILLVYPFLQKHFAKGIIVGAIKS
jgi:hypothetical protein